MRVTSKLTETFTPKFNGNQDLPEHEQAVVTIECPINDEFERYLAGREPDAPGAVARYVTKISGYWENEQPIIDGKQLVKTRRGKSSDLILECWLKILKINRLEEEEEKNSDGQSS